MCPSEITSSFLNTGFQKRSRWDIIYQILTALEKGETKKTRIMHSVYLDWRTLNKYLSFLEECKLIVIENGNCKITEKGKNVLTTFREIIKALGMSGKIQKL